MHQNSKLFLTHRFITNVNERYFRNKLRLKSFSKLDNKPKIENICRHYCYGEFQE